MEYINASYQLNSFVDPGILIGSFILIFFCTWLIGNGLSKERVKVWSIKFLKYFWGTFGVFVLVAFLSLVTYKPIPELIEARNLKINIAGFMKGMSSVIPNKDSQREYCKCVVYKLVNNDEIFKKYNEELKSGRIDLILIAIKDDEIAQDLGINECLGLMNNSNWTPALREGMKANILKNLKEAGFEKTNDVGKYCDCLLDEYVKIPVNEVAGSAFYETKRSYHIDSMCNVKSRFK